MIGPEATRKHFRQTCFPVIHREELEDIELLNLRHDSIAVDLGKTYEREGGKRVHTKTNKNIRIFILFYYTFCTHPSQNYLKTIFNGFKGFELTLKGDRRSSQILNFLLAGDVIIMNRI